MIGRGAGLSIGGTWDGSDGQDLFYPEYDSPESNGGIAHNMDWERRWALLGAVRGSGFSLHGRYSARTKAIPTGAFKTDLVGAPSKTRDEYGFLELRLDRPLDATRQITARTYLNTFRYDGDYFTDGQNFPDAGRNEVIGAEAALHWDIASSNRLTVGSEARQDLRARYFLPRGGADYDWKLRNTLLSAYVQDEHQILRSLSLLAGVRHDFYENSQDATSPRLAVIFAPSHGSTFKVLYGRAFRAPSLYEVVGGGELYKANPDILPEVAHTFEAVWQQRLASGLLGSVSLFDYDMNRLIDLTLDPADSLYQYRNVGDANADGFEAELQGRLRGGASTYLSYSYQVATDKGTGERLTNSPEHMLKSGATLELTGWLAAAVDARYETGRRTLAGTETDPVLVSDLHLLVPARSSAAGRGPLDRLELSLRLNNVFDAPFATPGGVEHRQAAITQDRRTVSAELRYRF
jgi:iron complex outermembrane receptor protein